MSQARTIADESNKLWQPVTGSREEWFRCHGVPCDQWHRTEEKLSQLKALARVNEIAFDGQVRIVIVQEQSSYREVVDVVNLLFLEGDCESLPAEAQLRTDTEICTVYHDINFNIVK